MLGRATPPPDHDIARSLLMEVSASNRTLQRVFSADGDLDLWTLSLWNKRIDPDFRQVLFSATPAATNPTGALSDTVTDIAHGRYGYVFGSSPNGNIYLSDSLDGPWEEIYTGKNEGIFAMIWVESLELYVGAGTSDATDCYIITSPDARNWTERAPSTPKDQEIIRALLFDGTNIIGLGDFKFGDTDTYCLTSPDGITWTERATPISEDITEMADNGAGVVIGVGASDGIDGSIIRSTNSGVSWSEIANPGNFNLQCCVWDPINEVFIAAGQFLTAGDSGMYIITSPDGDAPWTQRFIDRTRNNTSINSLEFDGEKVIGVGSNVLVTTEDGGITWKSYDEETLMFDVRYVNGRTVAFNSADPSDVVFDLPGDVVEINADGTLDVLIRGRLVLRSRAVFRDPTKFYNFQVQFDSSQSLAVDRCKVLVDGERITDWATVNTEYLSGSSLINSATLHSLCAWSDGYLADVVLVDGTVLAPEFFGRFDDGGRWLPVDTYALLVTMSLGAYGTNGLHLTFGDNSSTTTLGEDSSGNNNNWTLTGFTVSDSYLDTPSDNFCVMNRLDRDAKIGDSGFPQQVSINEGNLRVSIQVGYIGGTAYVLGSGKYYWEVTGNSVVSANAGLYAWDGDTVNHSQTVPQSSTYGFRVDIEALTFEYTTNGTVWNSITTLRSGLAYTPSLYSFISLEDATFNFGQKTFTYTPPAGYETLSSKNLPDPVLKRPSRYVKALAYTGDGGDATKVSGAEFQADLILAKDRANDTGIIVDSVRGLTKALRPAMDIAEIDRTNLLVSLDNDGFTAGNHPGINGLGEEHVAFLFRELVAAGIDIATYIGDGVAGKTVPHSLGAVPEMILVKNRDSAQDWIVYHFLLHDTAPEAYHLVFNDYAFRATDTPSRWNGTVPNSTQFTVSGHASVNENLKNHVAYLFRSIVGFSHIFAADCQEFGDRGGYVFCGFRPSLIIIKSAYHTGVVEVSGSWYIFDNARNPNNICQKFLTINSYRTPSHVWQVDDTPSGNAYVDVTEEFTSLDVADTLPIPATEAIGDYFAVGYHEVFEGLFIDYTSGTAGTDGVMAWEYWDGSAWVDLPNLVDGTDSFKSAVGKYDVKWTLPVDWAKSVINDSASLYWVRARVTTVYTINPVLDVGRVISNVEDADNGDYAVEFTSNGFLIKPLTVKAYDFSEPIVGIAFADRPQ